MVSYSRLKRTADRLIAKYGEEATLRRANPTGSAYDPQFGRQFDEYRVHIVTSKYTDYEVGQGRVKATDKRILLSMGDLAFEPELTDWLLIDGVSHRIVGPDTGRGIIKTAPGGTVVVYELQCRR